MADPKRAAKRRWARKNQAKVTAATRRWRHKHKGAAAAHSAVQRANKTGSGHKCKICGSTTGVTAHHPKGYLGGAKKAVVYLCGEHHNATMKGRS